MVTQAQTLEAIIKAFPYPYQITDIDLEREGYVCFTWRSTRFQVSCSSFITETVEPPFLVGDNQSILAEALIKRAYVDMPIKETPNA